MMKPPLNCHKRAAAFTAVLAALLVCTLLVMSMVRDIGRAHQRSLKQLEEKKAQWAAESGVAMALSKMEQIRDYADFKSMRRLDGELNQDQRFEVEIEPLLGYALVRATGRSGKAVRNAEALIGSKAPDDSGEALVVFEGSRPFYTSGNTRIEGGLGIPGGKLINQGLQGLPASQEPYLQGWIFDTTHRSEPNERPIFWEYYRQQLLEADQVQTGLGEIPDGEVWELKGSQQKFEEDLVIPESLKWIKGPGRILTRGNLTIKGELRVTGGAELISRQSIQAEAHIEGALTLLAGQEILLKAGVSGNLAAIARLNLDLQGPANLSMPSLLGLIKIPEFGQATGSFMTCRSGKMEGTILVWDERPWKDARVRVEKDFTFSGWILHPGELEAEGALYGHVRVGKLIGSVGAQRYDNWLRSLQISRKLEEIRWQQPLLGSARQELVTWL